MNYSFIGFLLTSTQQKNHYHHKLVGLILKMLKVGQKVKILKKLHNKARQESYDKVYWSKEMNMFNNKLATITFIIKRHNIDIEQKYNYYYKLDIDNGEYTWSIDWIQPIKNNKIIKLGVGTPYDFTICTSIENLKEIMALKLGETLGSLIIGYKLVPIYKIKANKDSVSFQKL